MVEVGSDVLDAWNDLKNDHTPTSWVLFGYDETGKNVVLHSKGEDGIHGFKASLAEDKIYFGGFRLTAVDADSRRAKFVYITWVGERVAPLKRAKVSGHKPILVSKLTGIHVEFHATEPRDFDEDIVKDKILASCGAHKPTSFEF